MAKVNSIIKMTGTIGGLNFYERNGVLISRSAGGGFNGKDIKKKASMARVRENGTEFRDCMKTVKHFKFGLMPMLGLIKNGETHQRLVSLFTRLKDLDPVSVRGSRSVGIGISTTEGKKVLEGYSFNDGTGFDRIVRQPYRFEWSETGLVFTDFDGGLIAFPKGATHLELEIGYYIFDFGTYESRIQRSEPLLLTSLTTGTFQLGTAPADGMSGMRIAVLLYRFYQEVNGQRYDFKENESRGLEVIFVG